MSGSSRRKPAKTAKWRLDQRSDPKVQPPVAAELSAPKPFLKWVGGKTQLLHQLSPFFPTKITRYFEPFLGGGAVFFHLQSRCPNMCAFLRDTNAELVITYVAVRDFPHELMQSLDCHLMQFRKEPEDYYYFVRSQQTLPTADTVARAARTIFLNKTCFNGLWRVNVRGEFNVPIGNYKNPVLYDRHNILAASRALQGAHIATQDFRATLGEMREGDFAYVDPPYVPTSSTSNFTSYTKEGFGSRDQHELATMFSLTARRGAHLILSNSDSTLVRNLYRDFAIHVVQARRNVNCHGARRGHIPEVLINSANSD